MECSNKNKFQLENKGVIEKLIEINKKNLDTLNPTPINTSPINISFKSTKVKPFKSANHPYKYVNQSFPENHFQ